MNHIQSPSMDEHALESRLKRTSKSERRITPADLDENTVETHVVEFKVPGSGQILRWGVIVTQSGFAVTGRPSCAVDPANDNPVEGERIALANAREEMWPLMGYALRERMMQEGK